MAEKWRGEEVGEVEGEEGWSIGSDKLYMIYIKSLQDSDKGV